jgi:general secretion pathway protein D
MTTSLGGTIRRLALPVILGGFLAGCFSFPIEHGEELGQDGRWEEAVRAYQEAVKQDPRNTEARLGLARAMMEAADQLVRQGQELEQADRLSDAAAAYRRALSYNGEHQRALAGLNRVARAAAVTEKLARARERMVQGEWRAAQAEIQAALRLDPENAAAKALKQEIALKLATEAAPSKVDADPERLAQQLFAMKPVTLRFRDTDIKEVLEVFARTAGVNIFTDESLQPKRITTFFQNLPLREAFNLILASNRLFAKKVAENTVIVVPDNPGKRQQYDELVVQTFYLTDADAKVVVNLVRTILNTRQVFVNEKLNALVIRETPEKIELARKVLEANDRGVAEVEIDLEVLEVDRESVQNLGIDLSPRSYSVSLGFPANIPVGDFFNTIQTGSVVNITNPSLILNLVKNDGFTNIIASPTVRILDRQKARLLVGERRPFQISSLTSVPSVAGTSTNLPTGAVTTTQTNVEYRDLGLKLTLTPTVHLSGEVTVELNFEISSAGAPIANISGGELLPPVNTRNLDTFIKVKNGETRLLGGLFQDVEAVSNSKIPFLSDIPLLGRVFTSPNQQRRRTDVLISLTPRVVKMLERPDPDIESFASGTADSFGPAGPAIPTPIAPPRPVAPTVQPPAGPGGGTPAVPGGGAPAAPGSGPGPRP